MDLPFLLGTMVSSDRTRAKALGYAMHFVVGELFGLVYFGIFSAIGHSGLWLGAAFGLAHGVFAGTALVNVLLPVVHPRMGTASSAAADRPLLEPPGFMMLDYGRRTRLRSSPRRRRSWCRRSSAAIAAPRWWRSRRCWPRTGSGARSPVWPRSCALGCIWARSTSASCTTCTRTRRSSRIAGCSSGCSGGRSRAGAKPSQTGCWPAWECCAAGRAGRGW
jgi:hypothetical protein